MAESKVLVLQKGKPRSALFQIGLALVGLAAVASAISLGGIEVARSLTHPMVSLGLGFSVLLFGFAALMAWRGSGDAESLVLEEGRVRWVPAHRAPTRFEASLGATRAQLVTTPGGRVQLFLREESARAVELCPHAPLATKQALFEKVQDFLGHSTAPSPVPGKMVSRPA